MSERTIADDLVDWLVYAPIGAVVTITEDLPGLVEKGRRRTRIVRFAGNVALKVARYRLDAYLDTLRSREPQQSADETKKAAGELEASARATTDAPETGAPETEARETEGRAGRPDGAGTDGAATSTPGAGNGTAGHGGTRAATGSRRSSTKAAGAGTARGRGRGTAKGDGALAIADYDTLAAAQVVKLLPGLSPAELEAVRRHELAGRSRATILNRIAQLTDGQSPRTASR